MLSYGTLKVSTASDSIDLTYETMRSPADFRRAMLDQKMEFEQADARHIAAAVTSAAQAPAATAQTPPAPSTPAVSAPGADEVTNSIARLAELRDSGAITPEEYEAKKAELLSRI
jgi:hypothetical protein